MIEDIKNNGKKKNKTAFEFFEKHLNNPKYIVAPMVMIN